eukprot:715853-Amphidinium_carterae.1
MPASTQDAPPSFSGIAEQFKEWKRLTQVWSMATKLSSDKHGAKVLSVLEAGAWDACRHLDLDVLAEADGAQLVIDTLEAVFGDLLDVALIESADAALYLTVKQNEEDLLSFQSRLDSAFRRLESNSNLKLPSELKGFILSKQAGMTVGEIRELLTLTGGKMNYDL